MKVYTNTTSLSSFKRTHSYSTRFYYTKSTMSLQKLCSKRFASHWIQCCLPTALVRCIFNMGSQMRRTPQILRITICREVRHDFNLITGSLSNIYLQCGLMVSSHQSICFWVVVSCCEKLSIVFLSL